MAAKTIIFGRGAGDTTTTRYLAFNYHTANTTEASTQIPSAVAGTLKELRVQLFSDPGAGNSFTFTLRLGGADTALTVTIADTTRYGEDIANEVSIAAGDLLNWSIVPASGPTDETAFTLTAVFESGGTAVPLFGGMIFSSSGSGYHPAIGVIAAAPDAGADNTENQHLLIGGTVTDFYTRAVVTSDTAASRVFSVVKNGSKEASSDITVTNGTGTFVQSVTGLSIAYSAADTIAFLTQATGTLHTTSSLWWCMGFAPTNAAEAILAIAQIPDTASARYALFAGSTTMDSSEFPYPMPECTVKNPYADVTAAPGAAASANEWDIDFRHGATVGGMANTTNTLNIFETATSDSDTTDEAYAAGEFFAIMVTPTSTPNAAIMRIAAVIEFPGGAVATVPMLAMMGVGT